MKCLLLLATGFFCANLSAHLNHTQFATVDEAGGKLHVRYRMSADMFRSNLDAEIKAGRLSAAVNEPKIDELIRLYFRSHLRLETDGAFSEALSATFEFDAKTSDWIADFIFDAPAPGVPTTLFCDAFLENNPRTQTLARIDCRGEKTMFHFRAGNERYVLGSSLKPPQELQAAIETDRDRFKNGLARALRAYDFLAAGALIWFVLSRLLAKLPRSISAVLAAGLAIAASALLSADQCAHDGRACEFGYALGWLVVTLTVYGLFSRGQASRAVAR